MLDPILGGLLIFILRVCDMSVDTLRVMSMVRGRKVRATLFALIEATIFITAILKVLSPPIEVWDMIGFACGFAGGTYAGMTLAKRLATDDVLIRVISPKHGQQICQSLRGVGFAVTVLQGEGRGGPVPILFSVVDRGDGERFLGLVRQVDPDAFVVTEPIDHAAGGFVPRPVNGLIAVRR